MVHGANTNTGAGVFGLDKLFSSLPICTSCLHNFFTLCLKQNIYRFRYRDEDKGDARVTTSSRGFSIPEDALKLKLHH